MNSNFKMANSKRHNPLKKSLGIGAGIGIHASAFAGAIPGEEIKVGVIGLSVHSAAYTEIINSGASSPEFSGCRVVAIFHPKGNPDVEFSEKQLQSFTETIKGQGVEFVSSIKKLLKKVYIKPAKTREIPLTLQKSLCSFRINQKTRHDVKKPLPLIEGKTLFLDRFEK